MSTSDYIRFRVNHEDKVKARELFEQMGFNLTQAFNVFLKQSLIEGGLPFQPHLKGTELTARTKKALDQSIEEEENDTLHTHKSVEDLIKNI